ncbi:MAG: aspartate aminotransferase family protein [Pseudomonadota bacterium]
MSQPAADAQNDATRDHLLAVYAPPEQHFVRGEGPYLFTDSDERYLDFFAGIAVSCLGHAHPELVATLQAQAGKLWHTSNALRVPQGEVLAARLAQLSGLSRTFFTNSGSESVECGLKLMRRYQHECGQPQRQRIIGFHGAFHGRSHAAVCAAGNAAHMAGFTASDERCDHAPFNDLDAVAALISDETAGIIVEPVQGEGGITPAGQKFLQGLRALCDEHGLLLMLDEVQCGISRTGTLFAFEQYGVQPDVIALAKGLGAGFPMGACVASEAAAAAMVVGTHGSTYGGNPLAMAVASKVIDLVAAPDFLVQVRTNAAYLNDGLNRLCDAFPDLFKGVRGLGFMTGLVLADEFENAAFVAAVREEKLLVTKAGGNVVRLLPPLNVTQAHIDEALGKLKEAAQKFGPTG